MVRHQIDEMGVLMGKRIQCAASAEQTAAMFRQHTAPIIFGRSARVNPAHRSSAEKGHEVTDTAPLEVGSAARTGDTVSHAA